MLGLEMLVGATFGMSDQQSANRCQSSCGIG